MTAEERRSAIIEHLSRTASPVSAATLAGLFGVSRQIVVGDVALLRAAGADVTATPRGYVMSRKHQAALLRRVACRHTGGEMETELNLMVDNGCSVLDVVVEHPIYGQLVGALQLSSRYDVQQFISRVTNSHPLSLLTEGIHLHTLSCPDEGAFQRVQSALREAGFLLED